VSLDALPILQGEATIKINKTIEKIRQSENQTHGYDQS
jgi:hypothetical protein